MVMSDKPYWHEVMTEVVFDRLIVDRPDMTWDDVLFEYRQPDWCDYPHALLGPMGCWSLALRPFTISCINDCGDCECVRTRSLPRGRRYARRCKKVVAHIRGFVLKLRCGFFGGHDANRV